MPPINLLKQRTGINGAVVYHFSPFLHVDVDYFRAKAEWWLGGNQQTVNTINAGFLVTW